MQVHCGFPRIIDAKARKCKECSLLGGSRVAQCFGLDEDDRFVACDGEEIVGYRAWLETFEGLLACVEHGEVKAFSFTFHRADTKPYITVKVTIED